MNNWQVPSYTKTIFKSKRHKYCVCIPVINEGEIFKKQIQQMEKFTNVFDIIIADGGSNDGSTDPRFLKSHKVAVLLVKTGPGRLSAQLRMGYSFALQEGYEGIITIDGNGKDNIQAIPDFIKALEQGYDFIQGSRFINGGRAINTPLSRYLAVRLFHAPMISVAAGFFYTDTTNGFRAYSKRFLLDPRVQPFRDIFQKYELLFYLSVRASQLGYRVNEIPVTRIYPAGKIPTKISSLQGNIDILASLLKTVTGYYNP